MLNKITQLNWLLALSFVILLYGCASSPEDTDSVTTSVSSSTKTRPAEYAYAVQLMKRGNDIKAYEVLTKLADKYPNADTYTNLAIINLRRKQYELALGNIEKSISINGNSAISRNIYGLALKNTGKLTRAETEYNKSISIDPGYADPYLNIAILYDVFLNSPGKSIPYYEKYKEISGKDIEKWLVEVKRRAK